MAAMHLPPGKRTRPGFMTPAQVADDLGTSRAFVRNLIDQGLLTRDSRGHVSAADLAAFRRDHAALLEDD